MKSSKRFWEIDIVRALALSFMLVQHVVIVWNFVFSGIAEADSVFSQIGHIGAIIFLLLVGVSGYILYSQKIRGMSFGNVSRIFLLRGLTLIGWGLAISLITFFALPSSPIYFGVLSFIGSSVILLPFLIKYLWLRWALFFTAPVVGYIFSLFHPQTLTWLPFGIYPSPFSSKDYWPIFPWITLVVAGVILGESLYTKGQRQILISDQKNSVITMLQWIGSHTLLLYMLHLPFLYIVFKGAKYLMEL